MSFEFEGPLHTPPKRQPVLMLPAPVFWLVSAIVGVHVIRLLVSRAMDAAIIYNFSFIPARYDPSFALSMGLEEPSLFWKVVPFFSHLFLHANWLHVGLNVVWLMAFGSGVSRRLGKSFAAHIRFLTFYGFCGVAGALAHMAFYPGAAAPLIGASGAISGLMGGALRVMFVPGGLHGSRISSLTSPADSRILIFVIVFVLLNVSSNMIGLDVGGQEGAIAWQAHLGGFFAGLFFFGLFDQHKQARL